MVRYLKEKLDLLKLARENQVLKKKCKTLKAENEILKSALRMREESGKKKRYLPTEKLEILKRYQEMVIKPVFRNNILEMRANYQIIRINHKYHNCICSP